MKRDGEMVIIPVAELVPGDVTLGQRYLLGPREGLPIWIPRMGDVLSFSWDMVT